ncbi:MAG: hypothetical protein IJP66_08625 [Kiritimatiellae bacterium]|nr:hypothetical protein [Kiritimatiellia bacterium]
MAMMVSNREKAMLAIVAILLLYASIGISFRRRMSDISDLKALRERVRRELNDKRALVAMRPDWEARYEEKRSLMPVFRSDERVETHWLKTLARLAAAHNVTLPKTQAGQEREAGGVYEMAIDCECEGSLESIVPFMHAIYSEGAMLDIRRLTLRPQSGKGAGGLRASFTLCCAYMRN